MNLSLPDESKRVIKDMYHSITPKKTRQFSENMSKRRKPFLGSENSSNPAIFSRINKSKSSNELSTKNIERAAKALDRERYGVLVLKTRSQVSAFDNESNIELNRIPASDRELKPIQGETNRIEIQFLSRKNLKIFSEKYETNLEAPEKNLSMETQTGKFTSNAETSLSSELSLISGYYSEGSINKENSYLESETSLETFTKQLEDQENQLHNSTFIHSQEQLNLFRSANCSGVLNDSNANEEPNVLTAFNYKPQNLSVPLITIKDIEITGNSFEDTESTKKLMITLEVPLGGGRTRPKETRESREKHLQMEHDKQVEMKDKVMAQLKEISQSSDFPKLKHFCTTECKMGDDGVCDKVKQQQQNTKNQEEKSNGFFHYIWNVIKQPFTSNTHETEKRNESLYENKIEETQDGQEGDMVNVSKELTKDAGIDEPNKESIAVCKGLDNENNAKRGETGEERVEKSSNEQDIQEFVLETGTTNDDMDLQHSLHEAVPKNNKKTKKSLKLK